MAADITILGLGISPTEHLTPEAQRALSASQVVLYVDHSVATEPLLARYCPRVVPLMGEVYETDEARLGAYERMAVIVVEAAMNEGPVCFAMQGHPLVFVYAPFLIEEMARALGLSVVVLPGVSAFDTVLAEVRLDPCVDGLQIYEATDVLLRKRPLQPDVPLLLWQVGNVESRLYSMAVSRPERFDRLLEHLLTAYPPSHPVTAVYTSPHPSVPTQRLDFCLEELPEIGHQLHPGMTLVFPPVSRRPVVDVELAVQVDDPKHLRAMTAQP